MDTNQTEHSNQKNDDILKDKTNQDYNKQKPNPNDPNQNKNQPVEEEENKNEENNINNQSEKKKLNLLSIIALFILSTLFSSCELVAGIFKAGMGFGIFIVVAVIVIIGIIIMQLFKNKS